MSLDVHLIADAPPATPNSGSGIFVRRDGQTAEITREEWDRALPGQEPFTLAADADGDYCVYHANITHNLNKMAGEAGIYEHLWRPDEIGITRAEELIEPLRVGLANLRAEPDKFKAFNPSNGWGSYEGLVRFVTNYLAACEGTPDATVRVSR